MTSSVVTPEVIVSGGLSGNPAGSGSLTSLQVTYQNLLSGAADIVAGGGTKTLNLTSGAITSAAPFMAGLGETSAEVATNFAVLKDIAGFCIANNIKIRVDANLTSSPTWSSGAGKGHNELVDQWAQTAAAAGLPIAGVEDIQEVSTVYKADAYASYASAEVNAVRTLIADYSGSTYHLTSTNLAVGDMEGGDPAAAAVWWKAYNNAAVAGGMPAFSYITADTGWFGPWIGSLSQPSWQSYLQGMSNAAALENMSLNVVVQGALTEASGDQFVRQSEQNAADLAMLQAKGAVHVSSIMLQSWGVLPVGVAMITSSTSSSNEAAEIKATYPLYAAGLITAQGTANVSTPGQIVLNTGTAYSVTSLSVQWDAPDVSTGGRLAVVVIDQTGTLAATPHGAGTVSCLANNILVLDGNAVDLAAELKSISLLEESAGPDTIDIQTYSTQGRVSDGQVEILAAAPGQAVTSIDAVNNHQGWVASSAILNSGTMVTGASFLTSETLYWNTTGTLRGTITGTTMPGQSAFTNIVAIHEPLAQYGVKNASGSELGTSAGAVADIYDPKIDYGAFPANGYANNAGVNNVGLAPLPGWISGAFDAAAELAPLVVQSTVKTFDPSSGALQSTVAHLAPDPITVVDNTGTHANTFATAFNTGGTQVTEFNTGTNAAWNAGWGNQFSAATLTYSGAGQLVEMFLQGNSFNPWFTIDDVFDPNSGKLWEEFQSTTPPPEGKGTANYATTTNPYQPGYATGPLYVTQFNTGDNPNWDYLDWGSSVSTDTEVWTDYFIMANVAGFVENFPTQYAGALNAYPYQFVNGSTLDVLNLPGTIAVNLNTLGTVTIASNTIKSSLAGLNAIDAAGATGTVTITGRAAGGSWLAGGDNLSTITGFGHDRIIAGAGVTVINTGAGASAVQITSANGAATVVGNSNVVTAATGSTVTISGNNDALSGSGLKINVARLGSLTLSGNNDVVNVASAGTITIASGVAETINGSNAAIVAYSNAAIAVAGTNNTISLIGSGITLATAGHNSLYVSDTATDVAGTLDALDALRMKGDLKSITLTDSGTPTLNLTAAQIVSDAGVLGLISSGFNINSPAMTAAAAANIAALPHVSKISITDTASHITASLDALQALATGGKLKSITLTDSGTPNLTGGITLTDSGIPNLTGGTILTNNAAPTLNLTAAQIVSDAGVLGLISSGFNINSPAMTLAAAGNIAALPHVSKISITDTASHITASLDALQALATGGKLKGITLTDSGTPTLNLTAAQLVADAGALSLISSGFNINSPAMTVAAAGNIAALPHVSKISITDTASHITASLDALQALATGGKLKGITLTDSGTPTLNLTAAQLVADAGALSLISSGFNVNSPAMTVAAAGNIAALPHVSKISITDTASHITASLDALQALATGGKLKGITLTDSGTPTLNLTAAQLVADAGVLGLISSGFNINSPAMTVAAAGNIAALPHVSKISITDTASHITASLDALQALATGGKLKGITLTDSGTPTLNLTAAQLVADAGALADITTPHQTTISGSATSTNKPVPPSSVTNKATAIVPGIVGSAKVLAANRALPTSASLNTTPGAKTASADLVKDDIKAQASSAGAGRQGVATTSTSAPSVIPADIRTNSQHIAITSDSLNTATGSANSFIHTGSSAGVIATNYPGSVTVPDDSTHYSSTTVAVATSGSSHNLAAGDMSKIAGISLNEFKLSLIKNDAIILPPVGHNTDHSQTGNNFMGLGMIADAASGHYTHIVLAENRTVWVGAPADDVLSIQPEGDSTNEPQDEGRDDPRYAPAESLTGASLSVQHEEDLPNALPDVGRKDHQVGWAEDFSRLQKHLLGNPDSLDDQEILEMVMHVALHNTDVRPIARALLTKYGTLAGSIAAPTHELLATPGLGNKGVTVLKLIQAAAVNVVRKEVTDVPILRCWDQLVDYLSVRLKHERIETFRVVFLDSRGAVIADEVQGRGTINFVAIFPREIVRRCLELHATALILVHNHPSGDPTPSRDDVQITGDVQRAAAIMGIELHDHIIVGRFGCRSFRQEQLF